MRRKTFISRIATLTAATLACLLLAVLAPMLTMQRASDEPFSGYAVMASPRDMHSISAPIRLSSTPDLTLSRGTLYADGNAAAGTPISRFVLDGAVFHLNASGPRPVAAGVGARLSAPALGEIAPLLVDQLMAMGFDTLTVRRGILYISSNDGGWETLSDIEAEVAGKRKGQVSARGSFTVRGQQLKFEAAAVPGGDKANPHRWPAKLTLKGGLLDASFEGHLGVAESLQLVGHAELATSSLRRIARWFGLAVPNAEGLNAAAVKGQLNWSHQALGFGDAKVTLDGNEATGALVVNLAGDRPLIDGTLAFNALDLTHYLEGARSQTFLFDRQTASWSTYDLSFPLIRHFDADVRISAPKVVLKGFGLGRGAATITVRQGKLLADIAELDLYSGKLKVQITATDDELVPRYTVRGKLEGFDAAPAGSMLFGAPVLSGRTTLTLDLTAAGQTPAEVVRDLSGKATLAMAEGGRVGLDVKALRASGSANGPPGWGPLAKGQTALDQVEARALIRNGVLLTETVSARSGTTGLTASGRIDLSERTLDLHLAAKANMPADKPLTPADTAGGEAVTVRGFWQEPFVRPHVPSGDAPR
jgi:AsmA protein